jgi:hypothetical protein
LPATRAIVSNNFTVFGCDFFEVIHGVATPRAVIARADARALHIHCRAHQRTP